MTSLNRWASTAASPTTTRQPAGRRRIGRVAGAAVTALLASTLVPGAMAPASAEVSPGPVLAANNLPAFFDDGNVRLALSPGETPEAPVWFSAAAEGVSGGVTMLYEAVLGADVVAPGLEMGASSLLFKLDGLQPGQTYTITHPYGVNSFIAETPSGRISQVVEVGCEVEVLGDPPCDWNAVGRGFLGDYGLGATGAFLKQDLAPPGTLGTPTPGPVTGAPSGINKVIVTGPGIPTLTVTDFAVQGVMFKDADGTPSTPDLLAASDTGRLNTDNVTNATLPTFTGTIDGFAGTEVSVTLMRENGDAVAPAVTTVAGVYTVTPTVALAQGTHMLLADAAGLRSSPRKFTVDTTLPAAATIVAPLPAPLSTDSTPTFNFTSVDPADTFECQLLPSLPTFAPCASGKTFAAQIDGAYTFNVRAVDVAGNVSVPTSRALRIGAAVTRLSDFNRDGFTDMVASDNAGRLWLYAGSGKGGFLARQLIGASGWNNITKLVSPGDVTGDGIADVLGRNKAGALRLYWGSGRGGFAGSRLVGTSGWNAMTAISGGADMTGDNRPDVLARDSLGRLWLYPTKVGGSFTTRRLMGASGWNAMTAIMGAGDLSGDGKADLLARDGAGKLWLYRGNSAGQLGARTPAGTGWAGMTALVTPGNWDRAGGNDLIARDGAGILWLYPGNNAGKLTPRRQIGSGYGGYTIA